MQAGILTGATAASGVMAGAIASESADKELPADRDGRSLRFLVLGGTGFIGPHMVREALRRGHTVELFNRGRTNDDIFPDLVTYIGDRDGKLDALEGGRWDVVIDNSGYVPRHVADSARLLGPLADHYIFISSISAYADFGKPLDEDAPLGELEDENIEEVTNETYGPLKALCEKRAAEEFGADRLAVLRPTYICGPGDRTDRYTYWPIRTARGGEMLWPGTPDDVIQIIDVRDLANFVVDAGEKRITGAYNTVIPPGSFTMGELLEDSLAVTAADTTPVWVDYKFLEAEGATEGGQLPIWVPPTPDLAWVARASGERAFAAGLKVRPTRETARDTLRWWRTLPDERRADLRAGLEAAEEARIIAAWRTRRG